MKPSHQRALRRFTRRNICELQRVMARQLSYIDPATSAEALTYYQHPGAFLVVGETSQVLLAIRMRRRLLGWGRQSFLRRVVHVPVSPPSRKRPAERTAHRKMESSRPARGATQR